MSAETEQLRLGWAQVDFTPAKPVQVAGQFYARISEKVNDPVTATALALEADGVQTVLVGCDLATIPNELRDGVRERVEVLASDLNPAMILMNATHTHTGPEIRLPDPEAGNSAGYPGVDLPVMSVEDCLNEVAERIAGAVAEAWKARAPGSVAFGQGWAVVGRNRRCVYTSGESVMYGETNRSDISHIDGYEDHSLNLLAIWDGNEKLSGLVVNVPSPSQVSEQEFYLSADYWHETRQELRLRLGSSLFILPQCSAAGDQSPHLLYEKAAEERMLALKGRSKRQEIAIRIADAVADMLPYLEPVRERRPLLRHQVDRIDLPLNRLSPEDATAAEEEATRRKQEYEAELRKLEADPALREQPRWYTGASAAYRLMNWNKGVVRRYASQRQNPEREFEIHTLRLGDTAMASVPFEYYLDYGIQIKARSPALQTFLVQLAGPGTYVPTERSVSGGGYGSVPASNVVGPEGGVRLAEHIIQALSALWADDRE